MRTLAILAFAVITTAQPFAQATADAPALAIGGDVKTALTLTPADLKAMPRKTVTVSEEGREVKYDGVLVGEVLRRAGAPLGRELGGQAIASYVLAVAKDGYQVVFSLA